VLQLDFFVYSRDAPGTTELRNDGQLLEEHWSYMDGFAESMIARGPTLDTDRETATGSLHVLALPSVDAAREFVALEPNNRAGLYREHLIRRFENLLGRSMWEFSGQAGEPRFLVLGGSRARRPAAAETLPAELMERLILYGALATLDGAEPAGIALALEAQDREAVAALVEDERTGLGALSEFELHNWEFGGRR
jgi:uncharacterized protein